jgi:hypothetical protein
MIDKFRKLVAVAEEMATSWNENEVCVDAVEIQVEGHGGIVRLGRMREYAVYHPDENQYMPEYAMDYDSYYYTWIDGRWMKDEPMIVEARSPVWTEEEEWDELPF